MAKSPHQKLKLLYLYQILREKTDEKNTLTVPQMIKELQELGVNAERKAIYDDLEALRVFGVDLLCPENKPHAYYVPSEYFELVELKILADMVASAKFLTEEKTRLLLKKISNLTSLHEGKELQRQTMIHGRVKTENKRIYYNIDTIYRGILLKKQIEFHYFDIDENKNKKFRLGKREVSPYALFLDNENYYLIGHYKKYDDISHFRVDRMENVEVVEKEIVITDPKFLLEDYGKKVFSMFGGEEHRVELCCHRDVLGAIYDKFGHEIPINKNESEWFTILVKVEVSQSFFGWVFQFNGAVKILSPQSVEEQFVEMLKGQRY